MTDIMPNFQGIKNKPYTEIKENVVQPILEEFSREILEEIYQIIQVKVDRIASEKEAQRAALEKE